MSDQGPRRARRTHPLGDPGDVHYASRAEARRARHDPPSAAPQSAPDPSRPSLRYGDRSVARHGRLGATSPVRSIGKAFGLVASVLIATMVILGSVALVKFGIALGEQPQIDPTLPPPLAQLEGGANVMVIGSDSRAGQGEEFGEGTDEASGVLNDVNIVFHMSEDQTQVTAVSIPRDTVVDTPACINDQGEEIEEGFGIPFNSILAEGGMSCVVAAAEELSGLDIQFAAMVQFRGVIEMSNAVGGVDVCVANEINDDFVGLYLQPGVHTLQGEDALKFLRSRHGVGDGSDISRISNQQVFLAALIREVKAADTLTNPAKLYGLATAVTNNMTLSSSLNLDTIMSFASALSRIPTENIVFAQLPVADSWQEGKVEPLEPDADLMWEMIGNDEPLNVAPQNTAPPDEETTGDAGGVDEPGDATGDESGTGEATGDPAVTDTPVPVPTVPGQNAAEETCSNVG